MRLVSALLLLGILAGSVRADAPTQFTTIDVIVDPGSRPLAAYQIEVLAGSDDVTLVGVEGGDAPAFTEPPRYDPRALRGGRIVLAAICLDDPLPRGPVRVASLHVEHSTRTALRLRVGEVVTGSREGAPIEAKVELERRGKP